MNILCAYDGSKHADAALTDLLLAGLPTRANVLVLSVLDAWVHEGDDEGGDDGNGQEVSTSRMNVCATIARRVNLQRDVAEKGAARLRGIFPGWNVTADACADSPAAAIIRRAEGECGGIDGSGVRADLTVVGSRGLGVVRRLLLGSVAQKVMRGLRGSLRISRGYHGAAHRDAAYEEGAPLFPPRIVVGVDGSDESNAAVQTLAARSWPVGTHVLVACYGQGIEGLEHSNAASISGFAGGGIWSGDAAGLSGPVDSRSARIAAKASDTIRGRCPGVSVSSVVRLADPSYALAEEAMRWGRSAGEAADHSRSGGADCIFVGARGVRGLERFVLGSVSSAVAMNAHCSVEIVHRRR